MKLLPDLITLSRLVSALVLLPLQAFSVAFFAIYTYCGISDILDGALARKLHCNDEFGARLDSIADIVFYAVTAFKIMPSLCNTLNPFTWGIIALVILLRIISYTVVAIKYHCFASLHTYMNKLTGLLVFVIPYIVFQSFAGPFCMIISVVAVIAAMEELIIHAIADEYIADRRTLFVKR